MLDQNFVKVFVPLSTVDILKFDVKFWTQKSELTQGNLLHSLTHNLKFTKQGTF